MTPKPQDKEQIKKNYIDYAKEMNPNYRKDWRFIEGRASMLHSFENKLDDLHKKFPEKDKDLINLGVREIELKAMLTEKK